jgi:hypothetical protein
MTIHYTRIYVHEFNMELNQKILDLEVVKPISSRFGILLNLDILYYHPIFDFLKYKLR